MVAVLRSRIFGLLCLFALGMLFVHSAQAVWFSEKTVACESVSGHSHHEPEGDCSSTPGCCHGHCPTVYVEFAPVVRVVAHAVHGMIHVFEETAPDAPAREIDLPPQLS
jgi:hypothetical protein